MRARRSEVIPLLISLDPEDKWGPAGYDAPGTPAASQQHFVLPDQTFSYRVFSADVRGTKNHHVGGG